MTRSRDGERGSVRAAVDALPAVALATLGAAALVHPLQHLGFRAWGAPWTAAPFLAAAAFALLTAGVPPLGNRDAGPARALGWLLPALAAGVAWPVLVVAFFPAAVFFGAPIRPLAALAALVLFGALLARPAWCAGLAVGGPLVAGAAALLAVNLDLASALALTVLLGLLGPVAARGGASENLGGGRRSHLSRGSDRDAPGSATPVWPVGPAGLVGPALLVAAAGFWAPAPSLGVPLLALNPPAVGAALGAAIGALTRGGLAPQGRATGSVLSSGGALAGYLAVALWTGVSLSGALGG
jgi:hypothetical protein